MTEIVFAKEGVYPFYCSFHAMLDGKTGMVGVAMVGDIQYTPPTGARGILPAVEKPPGSRRFPRTTRRFKTAWMRQIRATWCLSTRANTTRPCLSPRRA